jgi:S-DNA-T family DNA segregation ATPase FtsK/SpoIIIE
VRNIEAFNKHKRCPGQIPYWVVIIDELADLMMAAPYEVEKQICRLAQLARATGIHLIVATQRPSVDVVTGLIKANFPTRIAFAMSSQVDSRTILDSAGAEKLLGRGDMLYMPTDAAKPRRLQGVYVSDQEIEQLVKFWTQDRFADVDREMFDYLLDEAAEAAEEEDAAEEDPMFQRALELARDHQRVSTSMLQRRLRIGYPRAARLMDELEDAGIVGPAEGQGSRVVLAEPEEVAAE